MSKALDMANLIKLVSTVSNAKAANATIVYNSTNGWQAVDIKDTIIDDTSINKESTWSSSNTFSKINKIKINQFLGI